MGEHDEAPDRRRRGAWIAASPLSGVLRFIGRHVRGAYTAVLAYLSVSFILAVAAATAFLAVANIVLEGSTQRFDEAVLSWMEGHRTAALDRVALDVTALGNLATLGVLVLSVSVFLWVTRHRFSAALLLVAVAGGAVLNTALKGVFDRPRPVVVEPIADVMTLSFPSGHSMTGFTAYACVAYLVGRLEATRALRWTTWSLASLLILAVGASRVYLGVHYPTDVLAGYLAGLAWLGFVISGLRAVRYYASRSPEIAAEERGLNG